jgi:hypothetical protein
MIWVGHQAPNSPLSDHYDSNGAVPWARNVNIGGNRGMFTCISKLYFRRISEINLLTHILQLAQR